MLQILLLLVNFAQLFIEIYREFRVFQRDLRMRVTRENYQRRRFNELQRHNNEMHRNNNENED